MSKPEPTLHTKAHCILMDVEGTTSSVRYVYDVLFPFARSGMREYLEANWSLPAVQKAVDFMSRDLDSTGSSTWFEADASQTEKIKAVVAEVERLMDADIKSTGLKELQGLLWEAGYAEGKLCSQVYPDVPVALKAWREANIDMRIYSSGSIKAQQVFFAHTEYGSLSEYLSGHYDTTTGPKREAESYKKIAADIGLLAEQILFLSDIVAELNAASQAGMQVALVVRPGNAAAELNNFPAIESFEQIVFPAEIALKGSQTGSGNFAKNQPAFAKKKSKETSPERLVLALVENAHYSDALLLLDQWPEHEGHSHIYLYAKALALFGSGKAAEAEATLRQAFSANTYILPLMVERINRVGAHDKKNGAGKDRARAQSRQTAINSGSESLQQKQQRQAKKYVDLWFGSWLQTESAFDWLGNQFIDYTRAVKLEKLKAGQEEMLKNMRVLDSDFFLN